MVEVVDERADIGLVHRGAGVYIRCNYWSMGGVMDGVPPELMAKLDLLGIRLHVMRGRSTERFDRPPTKDTWYAYYVDAGLIRYKQKGYHNVPIVGHTALELVKKVLENLNASK